MAKLYKGMALGNLYQIYERLPLVTCLPTTRNAEFA
jgi:hypothetical protein